jgi:hypothetical protein
LSEARNPEIGEPPMPKDDKVDQLGPIAKTIDKLGDQIKRLAAKLKIKKAAAKKKRAKKRSKRVS